MSMSVGASSGSLSYLQSLLQKGGAGANAAGNTADPLAALLQSISGSSANANQTDPPPPDGGTASKGGQQFGACTMDALLKMQGQSASGGAAQSPSQMFSQLDTDGDGQISKSEFETALSGAGASTSTADALFAKLDTNGDGTVSQDELAKAAHGHHHHHMLGADKSQASGSSGQSAIDSLLSGAGANGATAQTITNPDGSTTTTISYADGSKVDMTTLSASTGGGTSSNGKSNQSNANLLEQLIKWQSQMLTPATSTLSAIA